MRAANRNTLVLTDLARRLPEIARILMSLGWPIVSLRFDADEFRLPGNISGQPRDIGLYARFAVELSRSRVGYRTIQYGKNMHLNRILATTAVALIAQAAAATGPEIGQAIPAFSMSDQAGTVQTLKSLMGPKGALLVFYRSADW